METEKSCSLCAAGHTYKIAPGNAFIHVVEDMTDDGRAEFIACADSSRRIAKLPVALKSKQV